jgi:beta-glucosidase
MPWLNDVQSVLEAWYPGERDGTAIAAALFGSFDPSGRLPLTFPASASAEPVTSVADFPGVDDVVSFGTGAAALDVGYRWYQAHDVSPLFAFGFGLSYTNLSLEDSSIKETPSSVIVSVDVTNTGPRYGTDVVQAYVKDPTSLGEPPEQLKAFTRVTLSPLGTRRIAITIPISSLSVFLHGSFTLAPGSYGVNVGQSSADLPLAFHVTIH